MSFHLSVYLHRLWCLHYLERPMGQRRRVKCGECPLVVAGPPWSQPLQEVNDTKSLAAGNWLQIDILRAEHESWKYPPSKLVTPNQTRHYRHYNYILLFQWFTGIDHSSAVEWLSRRFIKYSPTLQPPGVGLAIICKKRESREGLEDWPKNIAKNWETLYRKNITQLRKGHRQFLRERGGVSLGMSVLS